MRDTSPRATRYAFAVAVILTMLAVRSLMAPLRPVSATDRELASLQAATNNTRRLIRRIAAEGADDTAPERARRRARRASRMDEEASE